jgi:hypothetical protein
MASPFPAPRRPVVVLPGGPPSKARIKTEPLHSSSAHEPEGELGMQRYGTTVMGVEAWFGDGETVSWGCRWGSFIGIRVRVGEEVQLTAVTECDLGIIHKFILIRSDFGYKLRSLILLDSIFGSACEGEVHHGDDSGMHPQKQTAMGGAKMVDDS